MVKDKMEYILIKKHHNKILETWYFSNIFREKEIYEQLRLNPFTYRLVGSSCDGGYEVSMTSLAVYIKANVGYCCLMCGIAWQLEEDDIIYIFKNKIN